MPRCNERDIIRQRVSLHVHAAAFPLRSLQIISGYARMRGRTRNHYRLANACVHCCNSLPPNPGPPTPLFGLRVSVLQYTASPTYLTVLNQGGVGGIGGGGGIVGACSLVIVKLRLPSVDKCSVGVCGRCRARR